LYKLCYYTTPFEENSETNILHVSYAFPKVPHYSLALQQLINSMLKENPDDRPNIEQVKRRVEELRLSPPTKKKVVIKLNFAEVSVLNAKRSYIY
jgi:hypothetical protein